MKSIFTIILPVVAVLTVAGTGRAADDRGRNLAELCAPCHGATGISAFEAIPHLAGQQKDYLIAEMKAFRRATDNRAPTRHWNRRREQIMDHQLPGASNADIDALATYLASQSCALPKTLGAQVLPSLAKRCISCHGEDGRSTIATVPHLAGQQQWYLENQLKAFRDSGVGGGAEPRTRIDPIMGHQSVILGNADVAAFAHYFAGRRCR